MCSTYDFVCMLQDINWVSVIHVMFCVGWTWHGKGSGAVPWRKIRGLCMIMPRNSSAWNRCFGSQAWRNVLWNQTQPIPNSRRMVPWMQHLHVHMQKSSLDVWKLLFPHHHCTLHCLYPHYIHTMLAGWINISAGWITCFASLRLLFESRWLADVQTQS